MARYTCSYIVRVSLEQLQSSLSKILQSCNFDILYESNDYIMAQEIPGKVGFAKLVTVEVLIDSVTATDDKLKINFVIKNEELPLQFDNYCRQTFDLVQEAIAEDRQWQLVENVSEWHLLQSSVISKQSSVMFFREGVRVP